jgi:hypothetical protein
VSTAPIFGQGPLAEHGMVTPPLPDRDVGTERGTARQPRLQFGVKRSASYGFGNRVAVVQSHDNLRFPFLAAPLFGPQTIVDLEDQREK